MFCKMTINTLKLVVSSEKIVLPNFVNRTDGVSKYSTLNKLKYSAADQPLFHNHIEYVQAETYPTPTHLQCLRSNFGISNFKQPQWKVISSVLEEGRDNFVMMPSGYGKSLCYQFPAVYTNGLTVVISPLISLMQDQVKALQAMNIPACFLGPAQPDRSVAYRLLRGCYRVVYITPEYALSNYGLDLIERLHFKININLLAIDEAHCILNWGQDFRPAYGNLAMLRLKLPSVPVLALTSTATIEEKYGILRILGLRDHQEVCTGFDRTNLYLMTRAMSKEPYGDISNVLYEDKEKFKIGDGSIIIYCLTKKVTDKLTKLLNEMGISCSAYHSGLDNTIRKSIMDDFMSGKTKIIVATTAFGMGINKLDVRIVIHYGTPLSMEGYYQEVGRAGRDGRPALCVMYYSLSDFVTHRYITVANTKSQLMYNSADLRNSVMKKYVSLTTCRRKFIGNHFDRNADILYPAEGHCCDNCSNKNSYSDYLYDLSEDVEIFLKGIHGLQPKSFGIGTIISLLMGSTSDKNKMNINQSNPSFGSGMKKSEEWWKQIAFLLEIERFIKITNIIVGSSLFSKVILDSKGKQWLHEKQRGKAFPVKLTLTREMQKLYNKKSLL